MAVLTKTRLGGNYLSDGWVAHSWGAYQECIWLMGQSWKSCWWWIIKLIKKLWNVAWDMWEHHNDALHTSNNHQDAIIESKINDQVRTIFTSGLCDIPRDTFLLLQGNIEDVLKKTKSYKEQWVATILAAKRRKQHHEFGAYLPEQQFMQCWLGLPES